jgi:shikimate dehydrogenase
MTKYGLIGYPLSHSFSKKYFQEKFEKQHIRDAVFENYELPDIKGVELLFKDPALKGFCITIPYKKAILPYLDEMTPAVKAMQACNCVQLKDGKRIGHNTDVTGFEGSFTPHLQPQHKKALILGTGGAAAAVKYVLQKLGISYTFVSRNPASNELSYQDTKRQEIMSEYTVIINCSPVGTFPAESEAPDLAYKLLTPAHYLFDLVYNPPLTRFLRYGRDRGASIQNGFPMLEIQAEENWRIWQM